MTRKQLTTLWLILPHSCPSTFAAHLVNLKHCIIEVMLKDSAEITLIAGAGGNGKTSYRKHMKGPDGGNGGDGGNVYVVAKTDLNLLNQFSRVTKFLAEN